MNLIELLKFASRKKASDVHISTGTSPGIRIDGQIIRIKGKELSSEESRRLCYSVINDQQKADFEKKKGVGFQL